MSSYTVFSRRTGRIKAVISCSDEAIEAQMESEDDAYIEGNVDGTLFRMCGSTPAPLPPRPSAHHFFDYDVMEWIDPRTQQEQWWAVRAQRDALLLASDWTQLPDIPASTRAAWAPYRQALRDITEQGDPFSVVWPTKPGGVSTPMD